MRVYKFMSEKWAKEALRKRRLKISEFADLNDPFELVGVRVKPRELRRAFIDYFKQSVGVLCFSTGWQDPLLWSHYADRHYGVCLAIELSREVEVHEAQYVSTIERVELVVDKIKSDAGLRQALLQKLLLTKFVGWNYEKEVV